MWGRGRVSLLARVHRLRSKAWHIGQCAVAAGVAWYVAREVVGHPRPFFAPIVAVICLGTSYGQRLRRVAEVTVGVAVGVFLAETLLRLIGTGYSLTRWVDALVAARWRWWPRRWCRAYRCAVPASRPRSSYAGSRSTRDSRCSRPRRSVDGTVAPSGGWPSSSSR